MAEGIAAADGTITSGVHDDPDSQPDPGPDAPRGWTWNRKGGHWQARIRGPVLWKGDAADSSSEPDATTGTSSSDGPQRDPDPAWMTHSSDKGKKPKHDPASVPKEVRDDIGGMLGLAGAVLLPPIAAADPHCGGALADNWDRIAAKTIPLICRSERVVKWIQADGGGFMDWIGLAMALSPVAKAFAQHHMLKTVVTAEDEHGQRVVVPADLTQFTAE